MIDNFAIKMNFVPFDEFTILCKFNFCVRHVSILTKLLSKLKFEKMAEGRDNEYFSGFGGDLGQMIEEDEKARRQNAASQDVRIVHGEREQMFQQYLHSPRRNLRVGERLSLGHRNVAEMPIFPLSEREEEIPVREEII